MKNTFRFLIFLLMFILLIPFAIIHYTPEGCIPRVWVIKLRLWSIGIFCIIVLTFMISCMVKVHQNIKSKGLRIISEIFFVLLTIGLTILAVFEAVFFPEYKETEINDNKILVETYVWLNDSYYEIYSKEGKFYMKYESRIYNNSPYIDNKENSETDKNEFKSNYDEYQNVKKIMEGEYAIYETISENYENIETIYQLPKEKYSAKGVPELIVFENDEFVDYLVYDRRSANDKCELYVLYRSEKDLETGQILDNQEIMDMYAYHIQEKSVVRSGKTSWGDLGSEEYMLITGE